MSTHLVTSANRGIGLELCRQLSGRGDDVIAVCRSAGEDLAALGVEVVEGVDVTNDDSVARLVSVVGDRRIDWLINNAGILEGTSLDHLDWSAMERQFQVNSLGPLRVTAALVPSLGEGSKVGIITSRMGSIDDNTSGGAYGYRMSKAAVNIAGKSLSLDLAPQGIHVAILHPGLVSTRMTGHSGIPTSESAAGLIARMEGLGADNSGSFWHANGEILPW